MYDILHDIIVVIVDSTQALQDDAQWPLDLLESRENNNVNPF